MGAPPTRRQGVTTNPERDICCHAPGWILLFALSLVILSDCSSTRVPPVAAGHRAAAFPAFRASANVHFRTLCLPEGLERCFDARDDNCNGVVDEGCGLPFGEFQVLAAWAEPDADVDLEVTDPRGELAEPGRPTATGLLRDRDCPGRNEDCAGQNLEAVTAPDLADSGSYRVLVRLEKAGRSGRPIRVTLGGHVGPRPVAADLVLEREGSFETLWASVGSP